MPKQYTFSVGPGEKPGSTKVALDGNDISKLVTGVTVTYAVGELPRVDLDVLVFVAGSAADLAQVHVSDETKMLLMKLGWTPPTGDNE